jgi:hypothetical protein
MNEPARKLLPFTFHVKTTEFLLSQGFSKTIEKRLFTKVDKNGPIPNPETYPNISGRCWLFTGCKDRLGYGFINPGRHSAPAVLAHRASWIIAFGEIPDGLCALHFCDNPSCIRPTHMWIGTKGDNCCDCVRKGRSGITKLTKEAVVEIRVSYPTISSGALAEKFGVHYGTILRAFNGRTYGHLK